MMYGKWNPLHRTEKMGAIRISWKCDSDHPVYAHFLALLSYIFISAEVM